MLWRWSLNKERERLCRAQCCLCGGVGVKGYFSAYETKDLLAAQLAQIRADSAFLAANCAILRFVNQRARRVREPGFSRR